MHAEEQRTYAWSLGLLGGVLTTLLAAGTIREDFLPFNRWLNVAFVFMLWIGGQLVAWRRRPEVTFARTEMDGVHIGERVFPSFGNAVSLARGRHGFSLAVAYPPSSPGIVLEVESEHDARALGAALGAEWEEQRPVAIVARREGARALQRFAALVGVLCWLGYGITRGVLDDPDYKGIFGVPGILAGLLSTFFFVLDPLIRRRIFLGVDTPGGRSPIDAHARLHCRQREGAPEVRTRVLTREDETHRAWIARLDGIGGGGEGYRGDAPTTDELWRVLDDREDTPDARLGAARVLAKKYRVDASEICLRAVDISDRVDAILRDTPDEAAEALEKRGPYFRIT